MSEFVFTPGQKEEALSWYKENCNEVLDASPNTMYTNLLIDVYFKLKNISHPIKPEEFIIGIEYKDAEKVKIGQEAVNIRVQNPHKKGQYDEIAHGVLVNLLMSLKS